MPNQNRHALIKYIMRTYGMDKKTATHYYNSKTPEQKRNAALSASGISGFHKRAIPAHTKGKTMTPLENRAVNELSDLLSKAYTEFEYSHNWGGPHPDKVKEQHKQACKTMGQAESLVLDILGSQ